MNELNYLPGWSITGCVIDNTGAYRIAARYAETPGGCCQCGTSGTLYKHGTIISKFVDAPVHGRRTYIEVRCQRFRCRACGGTRVQSISDVDETHRMTLRCHKYIAEQSLVKTNVQIAEDIGVSEKLIRNIVAKNVEQVSLKDKRARRASLMECKLCKGYFTPQTPPPDTNEEQHSETNVVTCPDCERLNTLNWFR